MSWRRPKHHCRDAPALSAQLLRASARLLVAEGEGEAAIEQCRAAIGLVIPAGQADLLCELYLDLATMLLGEGQPEEASRELLEGVDIITLGEGVAAERGPRRLWRLILRLAQLAGLSGSAREAARLAEGAHRHAAAVDSSLGVSRSQSLLAQLHERLGDREKAELYRLRAVATMRALGDRRGTAELLLSGIGMTERLQPLQTATLREARLLAEEVGLGRGRQARPGAPRPAATSVLRGERKSKRTPEGNKEELP